MTNPQYFLLKQEFTTTILIFFRDIFNPLVKIKLLSYNTYATEKNNSTKRISRPVGIR